MEIFGIHLNEFEMIKGSLKVKTTIRKIFVSENPTKQNCTKMKITLSENCTK